MTSSYYNTIIIDNFSSLNVGQHSHNCLLTATPGKPIEVSVDGISKTSCQVKWSPPQSDGGSPIIGYHVEVQQQGSYGGKWVRLTKAPCKDTNYQVIDLTDKASYLFRVAAVNEAGIGDSSEILGPITPKDPFDKPGQPGRPGVSEMTPNTATVNWSPPKDDGNCPNLTYTLEMKSIGSTVGWVPVNPEQPITTTTYLVTGLKPGEYSFRVRAENKVGPGPFSEPSAPVKYGWLDTQVYF